MTAPRGNRGGFALLALLVLAFRLAGCQVNADAVYARLWHCDADGPADQCGTTEAGAPMTCYRASTLGGRDFCVEACDPSAPQDSSASATSYCVPSGARLATCKPNADAQCPAGLSCYRTNLNPLPTDEIDGLCVDMPVCKDDGECLDPERSTCVTTILSATYPETPLWKDHLYCTTECDTSTDCRAGETCMRDLFTLDDNVPRICLPPCDADGGCPPNFYCTSASGNAYLPLCSPGVPGFRCSHDEDCAIGSCRQTGAGFSICTLECEDDTLCDAMSGPLGSFFCSSEGLCVMRGPFAGAYCALDSDCDEGQCSDFDPFKPSIPRGLKSRECHRTCSEPGSCDTRGGVPYLCLEVHGRYGECYPGDFGLRCAPGLEECMGELECLTAGADEPATCTTRCGVHSNTQAGADAECAGYSFTVNGYCEGGLCRLKLPPGARCDRDAQCDDSSCNAEHVCQ
jgi:hypothetical protein